MHCLIPDPDPSLQYIKCCSVGKLLVSCCPRPFGTSTLLAAYDDDGPQLYLIEPSGICHVRPAHSTYLNLTCCEAALWAD